MDYYKGLNFKYDNKVDELIRKPFPINNIRFIHPRFFPNLDEITGDWGNLQLDTFGYFFLGLAEGLNAGLPILRDESDVQIVEKLISVLNKIQYWTIKDNGIWEENEEVHASSIGAVLSGLLALEKIDFAVPRHLIYKGQEVLDNLIPRESVTKEVDLALLTLIYPFNVLSKEQSKIIIENIEDKLVRYYGVIRYLNDKYYNVNGEAEWTFGFSFLLLSLINDPIKAEYYLEKILSTIDKKGNIPELFYTDEKIPNVNNPLGWSVAMAILAIESFLNIKK